MQEFTLVIIFVIFVKNENFEISRNLALYKGMVTCNSNFAFAELTRRFRLGISVYESDRLTVLSRGRF